MIQRAPKIPFLSEAISSGVGLTGALLALLGYESSVAMFGGAIISACLWVALNLRRIASPLRAPADEERWA